MKATLVVIGQENPKKITKVIVFQGKTRNADAEKCFNAEIDKQVDNWIEGRSGGLHEGEYFEPSRVKQMFINNGELKKGYYELDCGIRTSIRICKNVDVASKGG